MYHQYCVLFTALTVTFDLIWYHLNAGNRQKKPHCVCKLITGIQHVNICFKSHALNLLEPQYTSTPLTLGVCGTQLLMLLCVQTGLTLSLPSPDINSPYWLPYISLYVSSENLVFSQENTLWWIVCFILITCLLDNSMYWNCKEKLDIDHSWKSKGYGCFSLTHKHKHRST